MTAMIAIRPDVITMIVCAAVLDKAGVVRMIRPGKDAIEIGGDLDADRDVAEDQDCEDQVSHSGGIVRENPAKSKIRRGFRRSRAEIRARAG